jgi:PilZ domain
MSVERRRSARVPFVASAEIIDEEENTRSSSQVSDLSLHGCCVKATNPFPVGTSVTVEIYREADFLEAPATVAYFTPQKAMGLAFTSIEPRFVAVLKKWLAATSLSKTVTH